MDILQYFGVISTNAVILICTAFLVYCFFRSKNGMLRKLMIALFSSLFWQMFVETTQYYWFQEGYLLLDWSTFRYVANTPLCLTLTVFVYYILREHDVFGASS
jgi:Ni,Fe-hydrogenase I cytochrome b subunit